MKETPDIGAIVERVAGDVSLLTGAGASAAAGLPTMTSFIEAAFGSSFLASLRKGSPAYHMGTNAATQQEMNKKVALLRLFFTANLGADNLNLDLETFFEFIYQAGLAASRWHEHEAAKRLLWLFDRCGDHKYTCDFAGYRSGYNDFAQKVTSWMRDIDGAVSELRDEMYRRFLITAEDTTILDRATQVYDLLPRLFQSQPAAVFTLNFDSLFEALGESRVWTYELFNGIIASQYGNRFSFSRYLQDNKAGPPLYLFKLHGSVTWMRRVQSIIDTYPQTPQWKDADDVAVAEPVVSKYTDRTPFGETYRLFEAVLERNKKCIAIGISFRDDKLRDLISRRLADQRFHLIIVAPESDQYPELTKHILEFDKRSNVTWIKGKFGESDIAEEIVAAASTT